MPPALCVDGDLQSIYYQIGLVVAVRVRPGKATTGRQVMPDDNSEVEPLLPIPNRTVKRFSADDSGHSPVKVGHCQANSKPEGHLERGGLLHLRRLHLRLRRLQLLR